jgi:hypothetical protein
VTKCDGTSFNVKLPRASGPTVIKPMIDFFPGRKPTASLNPFIIPCLFAFFKRKKPVPATSSGVDRSYEPSFTTCPSRLPLPGVAAELGQRPLANLLEEALELAMFVPCTNLSREIDRNINRD